MEMQQSTTLGIGIIFWPTLALMYAGLIAAGIWVIWGQSVFDQALTLTSQATDYPIKPSLTPERHQQR